MRQRTKYQKWAVSELNKFVGKQGVAKPLRSEMVKSGAVEVRWLRYKPSDRTAVVALGVMLDWAQEHDLKIEWVHPNDHQRMPWLKYVMRLFSVFPSAVLIVSIPKEQSWVSTPARN